MLRKFSRHLILALMLSSLFTIMGCAFTMQEEKEQEEEEEPGGEKVEKEEPAITEEEEEKEETEEVDQPDLGKLKGDLAKIIASNIEEDFQLIHEDELDELELDLDKTSYVYAVEVLDDHRVNVSLGFPYSEYFSDVTLEWVGGEWLPQESDLHEENDRSED